ncbi:MAG: hypothetical protein ACRDK8_15790, partial [Solirubrobacteraceae bacterium]
MQMPETQLSTHAERGHRADGATSFGAPETSASMTEDSTHQGFAAALGHEVARHDESADAPARRPASRPAARDGNTTSP